MNIISNVLYSKHLKIRHSIFSFFEIVKQTGYPYFEWNEWIFKVIDDNQFIKTNYIFDNSLKKIVQLSRNKNKYEIVDLSIINQKVKKRSGKPFKSGEKVNTISGFAINKNTGNLAYEFLEDNSIVDVWKCRII